jgi:hypothetical protein
MQAQDGSDATLLQGVPARVEPATVDTPLGTDSIEADRADPRPDGDVKGLRCIMHNQAVTKRVVRFMGKERDEKEHA